MKVIEYKKPFNDEKMIYDYEQHRYILNTDFIYSRFANANIVKIDDNLLNDISDNVYLFIYNFKKGLVNFDKMEYELACNQYYREWLAEALLRQYQYAITSGGDIVQLQHGVDLTNDKNTPIDILRGELTVSYKTFLILDQHGFLENEFADTTFDYSEYRVGY